MKLLVLTLFCFTAFCLSAQIPKNGTYIYSIAFAEWNGKTNGATCQVVIQGDSITVYHDGSSKLTGKKGDILDKGLIMKHTKTGKWIIAHKPEDVNAPVLNGCEGPAIIDFVKRLFWSC